MSNDIFSFPRSRNNKLPTIRTNMIILRWYLRRIIFELITPCITCIYIDRITISIQFPYSRHLYIVPTQVVITYFPKISRTRISILHPEKFPGAIHGHVIRRLFFFTHRSSIARLIGKIISVHGSTINGIHFRILPFLERLCAPTYSQSSKQPCNKLFLHDTNSFINIAA